MKARFESKPLTTNDLLMIAWDLKMSARRTREVYRRTQNKPIRAMLAQSHNEILNCACKRELQAYYQEGGVRL